MIANKAVNYNKRISKKRRFDDTYMKDLELEPLPANEIPNDTKEALNYMKSIFPRERFAFKLPAIILKHQIYSLVTDKTVVDRDMNKMRDNSEIRFFKIDSGDDEFAVVYLEDYVEHVRNCAKARGLDQNIGLIKFFDTALPAIKDVSIEKSIMIYDFSFSEEMITILVNIGVLNVRDVKSWWLSIPGSSLFMKNLLSGRKAVLSMINKRRYREILEKELEERKMTTAQSRLGMKYHLHDLIGADMVVKVEKTSGALLRLTGADKKRVKKRRKLNH